MKKHKINQNHMSDSPDRELCESFKVFIEKCVSEIMQEQNVLAVGAVPGLGNKPISSSENSLQEINSLGVTGASEAFSDTSGDTETDPSVTEDDQSDGSHKRKRKKLPLTKKVLWMGDSKPGSLPLAHYVALEEQSSKQKTVRITCEKIPSDEYLQALKAFIIFCQKKLSLETIPHIFLHTHKKPHMTTGSYIRDDNTIHVLVKNRLLMDVLRTLSHELTHRKQDESGVLDRELAKQDPMDEMGDLNTVYENEAYEKSGNFVKEFARIYKNIPKDELFDLHESRARV